MLVSELLMKLCYFIRLSLQSHQKSEAYRFSKYFITKP